LGAGADGRPIPEATTLSSQFGEEAGAVGCVRRRDKRASRCLHERAELRSGTHRRPRTMHNFPQRVVESVETYPTGAASRLRQPEATLRQKDHRRQAALRKLRQSRTPGRTQSAETAKQLEMTGGARRGSSHRGDGCAEGGCSRGSGAAPSLRDALRFPGPQTTLRRTGSDRPNRIPIDAGCAHQLPALAAGRMTAANSGDGRGGVVSRP
jgi:hypothetical protein